MWVVKCSYILYFTIMISDLHVLQLLIINGLGGLGLGALCCTHQSRSSNSLISSLIVLFNLVIVLLVLSADKTQILNVLARSSWNKAKYCRKGKVERWVIVSSPDDLIDGCIWIPFISWCGPVLAQSSVQSTIFPFRFIWHRPCFSSVHLNFFKVFKVLKFFSYW